MHLKYKKENEMAMFVTNHKSKWQRFVKSCADVREKRRDIRETRKKITVCCQRIDYDMERPTGCFVCYNTVAFPWWTKSHPAKDTEFVSVCPKIEQYGLCYDYDCPMIEDRVHYCWAVSDLEHLKEIRRDSLRGLFKIQKKER